MSAADPHTPAFLAELMELERFQQRQAAWHSEAPGMPRVPLSREEPAVRRLMEALAFFSMRTREANTNNLRALFRRLFAEYANELLHPIPAAGLLQAQLDDLPQPLTLPRRTTLHVQIGEHAATFRTTRDLRLLPLRLRQTRLVPLDAGGWRLVLNLAALAPLPPAETLRVHVRYLESYELSLALLHGLRRHAIGACAFESETSAVTKQDRGPALKLSFADPYDPGPRCADDVDHPLARIRAFFHQPEQDLFFSVALPAHPDSRRPLVLAIDLDPATPMNLLRPFQGASECLLLHITPIVNLYRDTADLLRCDGLCEEYPIVHTGAAQGFALHSVLGVYEHTDAGPVPLRIGVLPGDVQGYEVEHLPEEEGESQPVLHLRLKGAFAQPRKISVDALWCQPWLRELPPGRTQVALHERSIKAVSFRIVGDLRLGQESPLRTNTHELIHLLALRTRASLSLQDLLSLLEALGTVGGSPYRSFPGRIVRLSCQRRPDGSGPRARPDLRYLIELREVAPEEEPLLASFLEQVRGLLDALSPDHPVELHASVAGRPFPAGDARAGGSIERLLEQLQQALDLYKQPIELQVSIAGQVGPSLRPRQERP